MRLIGVEGNLLEVFLKDEIVDVRSMIGESFTVDEIDTA